MSIEIDLRRQIIVILVFNLRLVQLTLDECSASNPCIKSVDADIAAPCRLARHVGFPPLTCICVARYPVTRKLVLEEQLLIY